MEQSVATVAVSYATLRNWERLHQTPSPNERLTKRANKKLSQKTVFPKEYIANPLNADTVQAILDTIAENEISIHSAVCSLCVALLHQHCLVSNNSGLFQTKNRYIESFVDGIIADIKPSLLNILLPADENDIVGLVYQCLQFEGQKNIKGSYFTPKTIIKDLTADIVASQSTILDPCCGTGGFLAGIDGANPENLYGIDIDPLAVMIAKTNLFIKYKEHIFDPHIFCADYLAVGHTLFTPIDIPTQFDYIISNPPWGASTLDEYQRYYPKISSGESFSYFIAQSVSFLKDGGELRFLLPESILNVKTHQDIRRLILEQTTLKKLSLLNRCFSGVYTPVVSIQLINRNTTENTVTIETGKGQIRCSQNDYLQNDHYLFTVTENIDKSIIETIYQHPHHFLLESKWALGIVTGDNKSKLHKSHRSKMEHIYTGKDVWRYTLKAPTYYILYDRPAFQQVAPDEMYRAKEKLVYKFISNRLAFAYDDTGSLFLNSANILIPNLEGMSIKAVLALLNSTVFQYLYIKKFGEIKVLRGNLEKLPFPKIEKELDACLTKLVDSAIAGDASAHNQIQQALYEIWGLTEQQIAHIEEVVYG